MSRFVVAFVALLALTAIGPVAAQSTATLDYPELVITVRGDGFDMPSQVAAGRYLVTVENELAEGTAISFVQSPAGHSLAETQAALADPNEAAEWLYEAIFVGGPHAASGSRGQGIVNLTPGEWLVWSGEQGAVPLVPLTVTPVEAGQAALAEPGADLALEVREYAFIGLDAGVPSGPQIWRITNTGTQPHLIDLVHAPGPITFDQVMTVLALPDGATPPPGIPAAEEFTQVAGIGTISPGQTAWMVLPELAPGAYIAACFVPDRELDGPHAAMGMVQVFTIEER